MMPAKIDYGMIPVIEVARGLLGDESKERSTAVEKHFDGNGGLFVNTRKNRWYSHGNGKGGDAIELVRFVNACDFRESLNWLRLHGFESYVGADRSFGNIVAEYDYVSEDGEVLYQVVRLQPKDFRQRRPDGKGGWRWKGPDTAVPYRLPELRKSGDAPVLIAGGEKDVDNLRGLGFTSTCNHGGEGKWWPELTPYLNGKRVFILCDNDTQGEKHQEIVGAALNGVAAEIRVVRFPELAEGEDVSDFINTRLNAGTDTTAIKNELAQRFRAAPEWDPKLEAEPTAPTTEAPWPVLAEDAYHGLAGDIVRTIKPHSESDPVAILVQVLTVAGNIMGRTAYYQVESDRHHPNLFSILVGESSKARKGTSYGRVRAMAKVADELWADNRTKGGLSSGEGFISEVRDAQVRWDQKAKEWEEVDPGITDKRLTIIEPEFAGALAVMERHGNTLSPLIRRGWDGDTLSTMTRNNPLKATGAHISIIGHITDTELKARLTRTDAANGFANRFLFVLVKRSKLLPFGGDLTDSEILGLGELLKKALVRLPAEPTRITMTDSAKKVWATVYGSLSDGKPGLLGAVTARAEAQVIRMAMIYALLDGERQIDEAHLRAGLAVWEYCEASATHIFGNASGDPVVDELLAALRQAGDAGMTRSVIRDFFGRHQTGDRIAGALGTLLGRGLARCDVSATGGRPTETWVATKAT